MADTGNSLTKAFGYVHARPLDLLAGPGLAGRHSCHRWSRWPGRQGP
jgi:hypothetical protein